MLRILNILRSNWEKLQLCLVLLAGVFFCVIVAVKFAVVEREEVPVTASLTPVRYFQWEEELPAVGVQQLPEAASVNPFGRTLTNILEPDPPPPPPPPVAASPAAGVDPSFVPMPP